MTPPRAALIAMVLATPALAEMPAPVTDGDYRPVRLEEVELGRLLFWDPVISGNRNISCGTCHQPRFGTSDGVSLGLGEGGVGLGPERRGDQENMPPQRVPRNTPALFNLGAVEFTRMFHDGRIEIDTTRPTGLRTPLPDEAVAGFASVLAAQTVFPMLSAEEMAGQGSENEISKAVRFGFIAESGEGALALIAARVAGISEYRQMFAGVYPEIGAGREIALHDISNAIAAFVGYEWRSDGSPFDLHLRGENVLSDQALAGMQLFYGEAGCSGCHSGKFQTDHAFHATGAPQLGPGKTPSFEEGSRDVGRMEITGDPADAYAFRTPSLRNVTKTGPWGHAGGHVDLEGFLRFHVNPLTGMENYRPEAVLPDYAPAKADWAAWGDPGERAAIRDAVRMEGVELSDENVANLLAFLESLTDEAAIPGRLGIPDAVPSGLPVDR